MDSKVLTSVVRALDSEFSRAALSAVRLERADRLRFVFRRLDDSSTALVVSLAVGRPWIGKARSWIERDSRRAEGVGLALLRLLVGTTLERIERPTEDRIVRFRFALGRWFVVELFPAAPNAVLLDPEGKVQWAHRIPRSGRIALGNPYRPPPIPASWGSGVASEASEADSMSGAADAATVVGEAHDALERAAALAARGQSLQAVLRREFDRVMRALRRAEVDRSALGEPDSLRRSAEALLTGLAAVRRSPGGFFVPDPWAEGQELHVPARPDHSPVQTAERLFRQARRAARGIELARRRSLELEARRTRLQALAESLPERFQDAVQVAQLEQALRQLGVPVGLQAPRGSGRGAVPGRARVEDVRLAVSQDGLEMLVGRSGRANDRLTFRLAGPEDFWFHAAERAGAHVIVRNPRREPRPPPSTLVEAAAVAAWYSGARAEPLADVYWTRRKYVRRIRGAEPGTVRIKKRETVRVRPSPLAQDGSGDRSTPG